MADGGRSRLAFGCDLGVRAALLTKIQVVFAAIEIPALGEKLRLWNWWYLR